MTSQLYFEDVEAGDSLGPLRKDPTTRQLVMYAGVSGDFNEIHYDQEYARIHGLSNIILHGALKNAFLAQMLTDWMGDYGEIKILSVQYRATDEPGSPVYCKGLVKTKDVVGKEYLVNCDIWLENASGDITTPATVTVSLPSRTNSSMAF